MTSRWPLVARSYLLFTACRLQSFHYLRQLTHFHAIMNLNKKYMIVNTLNFEFDGYRYCRRNYRLSDRDHCW